MTTVLQSLNHALHRAFAQDERTLLLGEDVLDPYGGAFKVTQGLSNAYPERVLTTPISEAGIVGVAAGLALRGLRPVVEIMFGDFLTLAADQIINHIAKFRWMYNDQVRVPMVIRTPMGGRRGYGPTHSQTLEKLFLGIPGIRVISPTAVGEPGELLYQLILESEDPVLFIENKLLYLAHLRNESNPDDFIVQVDSTSNDKQGGREQFLDLHPPTPTYTFALDGAPPPSLTIAAYGYMAELARQAAYKLAYEYEIFTELVIPTQLAPFEMSPILMSSRRTGRLLVLEEGTLTVGWGAEILARAVETPGLRLNAARRLASIDLPIPASKPMESVVLPKVSDIIDSVLGMLDH